MFIKQLSFSQCGESHEPREEVQGQRQASSRPAKNPEACEWSHEDVKRHVDTIMNISSCDEILIPPNRSHMDFPGSPAIDH